MIKKVRKKSKKIQKEINRIDNLLSSIFFMNYSELEKGVTRKELIKIMLKRVK